MLNDLRISGLSSGIDYESIINKLMTVERIPLDKVKQQKQVAEWQRDQYREMNTTLTKLRDNLFNMRLQSTYLTKKATSANESVATVTASSNAVTGNYSLKVNSLASGATITSNTLSLTNPSTDPLTATATSFTITGEKGTATINVTTTDTIYNLVSNINAQSATTGVQVSYDANVNRLFFVSTTSGANSKIDFSSNTGSSLDFVQNTLKISTLTDTGTDANIDLNDATGLTFNSNTFSLNGLTFNLKSTSTTPINISVTNDVDAVYNSIKSFVDLYNETISTVYNKTHETRYRDYQPLTDEQKKNMSDKEIELWEEKAKSGLIRNDSILAKSLNEMRRSLSDPVTGLISGAIDQLSKIGITTGSYLENGKLYIDEAKLREAIANKPEEVMNLFTVKTDGSYSTNGLAQRLYDNLNNTLKSLVEKAGYTTTLTSFDSSILGKQISLYDEEIVKWNERLTKIEDRYWKEYTAMEKALNDLNAQSAWLSQQLGTGA